MNYEIMLTKFNEGSVQTRRFHCVSYEINRNKHEALIDVYVENIKEVTNRFLGKFGAYHQIVIRSFNGDLIEEWNAEPLPEPASELSNEEKLAKENECLRQELDEIKDKVKQHDFSAAEGARNWDRDGKDNGN